MNRSGKLHALLSTARVANIPSVVSNVWLGVAVGAVMNQWDRDDMDAAVIPCRAITLLLLAGVCLYVAGNFLNDWMDRRWDSRHRPERALPRGLFQPTTYLIVALVFSSVGVALAGSVNPPAALIASLIVACILIYTILHKRTLWSVIPMGMCRSLLLVLGTVGMRDSTENPGHGVFIAMVAGVVSLGHLCYIIGLSLSARFESKDSFQDNARNLPRCLFVIPPAIMAFCFLIRGGEEWWLLAGIFPYVFWVVVCDHMRRTGTFRFVSLLLAGIPLVDWIFLLPIGLVVVSRGNQNDLLGIAALAIPPIAFISALLLQRLAPAT